MGACSYVVLVFVSVVCDEGGVVFVFLWVWLGGGEWEEGRGDEKVAGGDHGGVQLLWFVGCGFGVRVRGWGCLVVWCGADLGSIG